MLASDKSALTFPIFNNPEEFRIPSPKSAENKNLRLPSPHRGRGVGGEGDSSSVIRETLRTKLFQARLLQLSNALPNLLHKLCRRLHHNPIGES